MVFDQTKENILLISAVKQLIASEMFLFTYVYYIYIHTHLHVYISEPCVVTILNL